MSLNIHFLNSHLDFFSPKILVQSVKSEEQGERSHQDIKEMEWVGGMLT
jgi:hypothetical protein